MEDLVLNNKIFMKKIISLGLTLALAGCAGGANTTQILTQSTDEKMPPKVEILVEPSTVNTSIGQGLEKEPTTSDLQPEMKFTIQVVALRHNIDFSEYITNLPTGHPIWSNEKEVNGLLWFTLLYGEFPSIELAQCVLKALPDKIQKRGPYIRSLKTIKSSTTPEMIKLN